MEDQQLIPYSVHLRPDIHAKIKAAAGERKAASIVRNAITSFLEGGSAYENGRKQGILEAIAVVQKDSRANGLALNGEVLSDTLTVQLKKLIPSKKGRANGNKKT